MPEDIQELGREGAATLKRWLEATTYMELPFDAYHHEIDCMIHTLGGQKKQLDLVGYMLTDKKAPVFIECKRYKSAGRQYAEYIKFLAIAYGHTAKELTDYGKTRESLYYWVTYHPFNLDNWSKLETYEHIKKATEEHPEFLGDTTFNAPLAHEVASRVTVLVFNPKQEALSLTRSELETIRPALERKAKAL
ncbi:hypothetical protein [Brachybacterium paraconglomeratum]|uniref:hypothetical protein n=1 Tax=Brachybacterium paraconglomeratum TaxID=173362 RepID=UPI0038077701